MERGFLQIYTGNGKGKTTAAFGLALRAAGAKYRVFVGQFVKSMAYSEVELIRERLPEIEVELFGTSGCIWNREPTEREIADAKNGLAQSLDKMCNGNFDVIILDEISIALKLGLIALEELIAFLDKKPVSVELVLTGRYFPETIIERADLVTNMAEEKHYYRKGIVSRKGIEV